MDWTLAIERNSTALKRIVAMLVGMAGLGAAFTSPSRGEVAPRSGAGGGDTFAGIITDGREHPTPDLRSDPPPQGEGDVFRPTLPRRLHRAVLRLLHPAESAVRRLIVIAARGLVVSPSPPHPARPKPPSIFLRRGDRGTGIILPRGVLPKPARPPPRSISLPLFDRVKRPFEGRRPTQVCVPRIAYAGPFATLSPVKIRHPPTPDDRLDATRLTLRLQALTTALDDLPRQAQRLARWRANRAQDKSRDAEAAFLAPAGGGGSEGRARPVARPGTVARAKPETVRGSSATSQYKARHRYRSFSPLRPGRPPGFSRQLDPDVQELLTDLHGLAFEVLEHPDTS